MKKKNNLKEDALVEVSEEQFKKFLINKFRELEISAILYSKRLGDIVIFDDEVGHDRVLQLAEMEIDVHNERKKIIVQNTINDELQDLKKIKIPKYVD